MLGFTSMQPDNGTLVHHDTPITMVTPDGRYLIHHFPGGQLVDGKVYFWAAAREGHPDYPEVFATSLERLFGWLANRLLETCF